MQEPTTKLHGTYRELTGNFTLKLPILPANKLYHFANAEAGKIPQANNSTSSTHLHLFLLLLFLVLLFWPSRLTHSLYY